MLKRAIAAGVLALSALGVAGAAQAAEGDYQDCASSPAGTGLGIFVGGVTDPAPYCGAYTTPVEDPTAPPQYTECDIFLVVIASCA